MVQILGQALFFPAEPEHGLRAVQFGNRHQSEYRKIGYRHEVFLLTAAAGKIQASPHFPRIYSWQHVVRYAGLGAYFFRLCRNMDYGQYRTKTGVGKK